MKKLDWKRIAITVGVLILTFLAFTSAIWLNSQLKQIEQNQFENTKGFYNSMLPALGYMVFAVILSLLLNIYHLTDKLKEIKDLYYHSSEDK